MNKYKPVNNDKIKVSGRTVLADPLPLFWTASGVEFKVDGSELSIDFITDYDVYEVWVRVEVDGYSAIRTSLPKGKSTLGIYKNMNPDNIRNIRVYKEVQAMGDASHILLLDSINSDGRLYAPEDKKYRFEFVGDSITSGEGLCGSKETFEWNSFIYSTENHYAVEVCKKLNADLRIVSQSGWGTYCGWNNDVNIAVPPIYEKVCGLQKGEKQVAVGSQNEYGFSVWQPDVIFINLGTNDYSAFNNPEFTDPATGVKYKQIMNEDGSLEEESKRRFIDAAVDFLKTIRKNNGCARLVWIYGMIGHDFAPVIIEAVEEYKTITSDENADFLLLPDTKEDGLGANWHPGKGSHRATADRIIKYLADLGY